MGALVSEWFNLGTSELGGTTPAAGTTPSFASEPSKATISLNLTSGPTGLDPYRPWSTTVLDGLMYVANGFDQPKRWDGASAFYNLGANAATGFTVADSAGGSTFTSGVTVRYRLCFRNTTVAKETCPQLASSDPFFDNGAIGVAHTMVATRDIDITWTDPGGEWDKIAIYRALAGSDTYHRVALVTAATETYTDSIPDATLRADLATYPLHVPRTRTTLPPKFLAISDYLNRLWGFERTSTKLRYSQIADPTGELTQEDYPSLNYLQIVPEDGNGYLAAASAHYDSFFAWKDRAAYEITGASEATFGVQRMYADRGAFNQRCIVETDGFLVILDQQGLYLWTPGGQPVVAAAVAGSSSSRLDDIWSRMNLSAAEGMFLQHDRDEKYVYAWVALDGEPVPNVRVVYDYADNKIVSVDVAVWGTAGGDVVDATMRPHAARGCDLGYLWEDAVGNSEGVTEGDLTATITTGTKLVITASGASIDTTTDGPVGAPYVRGVAGSAMVDTNRAYSVTGTTVVPYYYSSASPANTETLYFGAIPAVARLPKFSFGTADKKHIRRAIVDHDSGYSGTVTVKTAQDDGSFATKKNIDTSSTVRNTVPCDDRCWTWSMEFSQNGAGSGFAIRGVRVLVKSFTDRKA